MIDCVRFFVLFSSKVVILGQGVVTVMNKNDASRLLKMNEAVQEVKMLYFACHLLLAPMNEGDRTGQSKDLESWRWEGGERMDSRIHDSEERGRTLERVCAELYYLCCSFPEYFYFQLHNNDGCNSKEQKEEVETQKIRTWPLEFVN